MQESKWEEKGDVVVIFVWLRMKAFSPILIGKPGFQEPLMIAA